MPRPSWVEVDLDAISHNVRHLVALAAPADVCAVVKADAYGHGDVPVAEAALAAGAERLAVALVAEAIRLREAGIDAPILVLCEPEPEDVGVLVRHAITPTVSSLRLLDALRGTGLGVELAVDTGMHRAGVDADDTVETVRKLAAAGIAVTGTWTHLAAADDHDDGFVDTQVERFEQVLTDLAAAGLDPGVRHMANSAGLLYHPATRFDQVRVGLAIYGLDPDPSRPDPELRPALSVRSRLTHVRSLRAGDRPSYGRIRPLVADTQVGTIPIGYADGYARGLGDTGFDVLIGGRRRPLAGRVTMDQIVVDLGPDGADVGAEVVLLGGQDAEWIGAEVWAERLGTIHYEVVARLGTRLPRRYRGGHG